MNVMHLEASNSTCSTGFFSSFNSLNTNPTTSLNGGKRGIYENTNEFTFGAKTFDKSSGSGPFSIFRPKEIESYQQNQINEKTQQKILESIEITKYNSGSNHNKVEKKDAQIHG